MAAKAAVTTLETKRFMNRRPEHSAFTLLELILVMLILAIVAALVVPSLANFAIGRSTDNAVLQFMNLASYARAQAMADATTYRINFDTQAGQVWLTEKSNGMFQSPPNDYGNRMTLKDGMKIQVQVVQQPNVNLITDPNVQPQDNDPKPPFGQVVWPSNNTVMQIPRTDNGTYIEIQPSGRTDPALVRLTDRYGRVFNMGLATSTEVMHLLKPEEMK